MTYSIVARDPKSGEMGVAVQSHYFSVGSAVPWARAGVGAVATQAMLDKRYGPLGLELMSSGVSGPEALSALLKADSKPQIRQVAMVDSVGRVAAHTGEKCIPSAGHVFGTGFSCQGNIMSSPRVWLSMAKAFEAGEGLPLPERLMATLEAAENAGGDIRGRQSAAMLVVGPDLKPNSWEGRIVDLRVEDSPAPLSELKRLLRYQRGYTWVDRGDDLLSSERVSEALDAYKKGMDLVPEVLELKYWVALGLVSSGEDEKKGIEMLREIYAKDRSWVKVTEGVIKTGSPPIKQAIARKILP